MVQHVERARPPGRNDPCPCGSGKKYKRCCLLLEERARPVRDLDSVVSEVYAAEEIGDQDSAIRILETAREGVQQSDLDSMLVERYMELGPERAEGLLRAWWEREHDRFSGAGLAHILVATGRKEEALQVLAESSGQDALPEYWSLLAELRDEQGDVRAAVTAMELYVRMVTESAEGWLTLADMQTRAGMNDRALLSLRRAADLTPEHILPRALRLRILADDGRWREARDFAEALLEGRYDDTTPEILRDIRDVLARAHYVLGNFDSARLLWVELLHERPEDDAVRFALATLELDTCRYRQVLLVLQGIPSERRDLPTLDLHLRALLELHEYDEAAVVAGAIEEKAGAPGALTIVHAARAIAGKEYAWALEGLVGDPPPRYADLWHALRLDCLAHLGRWSEIPATLRVLSRIDDRLIVQAALAAMAAGKLDLVERLADRLEDQSSTEARAFATLLGPLRQARRAEEARRQQHVDQAERQRWANENRDLRRKLRALEEKIGALEGARRHAESALERILGTADVSAHAVGNWEEQVSEIVEQKLRDVRHTERLEAERRIRSMLGDACWHGLSESVRDSLREGEWLFTTMEGDDRDYGASLLQYARGLESAFKDAIFVRAREYWMRFPGSTERLNDEGHDPSLGPFVRYVLTGGHLTLGSMAAALDRMSDARRQGVAISLLRRQLEIDPTDDWTLSTWKRVSQRLAQAADARNEPAHAARVDRPTAAAFRAMVVGTDGLLAALCNR